jgi:predicted transcriptional regulator
MPTLDELANKKKKKFIKSEYRPWNYMEETDKESDSNHSVSIKESYVNQKGVIRESIGNQLEIKPPSTPHVSLQNKHETTIKLESVQHPVNNLSDIETTLDIIFRLTGHQKKIFIFIIDRCMSRGMLSTGAIRGETLSEITDTTMKMIKTSIQRLISKKLVIRERGKTGRGGFYSFRVLELVRNAAIEYKRMLGFENQIGIKKESNGSQQDEFNGKRSKIILSPEWESINISPLEDIGFNQNHLMDIIETGLSDYQTVQDSILHFAYGLEYEPSKYKYDDLLNVFIGRLRKGKPWYEQNYRSPQELAQEQFLANKKAEIERKKILDEEIYKLALDEWQKNISPEEIEVIAPDLRKKGDPTPQNAKLSLYFKENIWPSKKDDYFKGYQAEK